ncbi:MAG: 50S ribosomal protein L15 [bacterium]|nr:50S ribosomal protein L15 [bacterium]
MRLHTIKPFKHSTRKPKRIGRGLGSGHGAYSTRGMKGQKARSGGSKGLKLRGLRATLLRVPKLRGFKSIHGKALHLNVSSLNDMFSEGDIVSPETLLEKKLITLPNARAMTIKILGDGELTKKLTIQHCSVSKTARIKIEKAGGTVEA